MDDYQRPRRRRRGLLALLMAGTAIISATGVSLSLAYFGSTVAVGGNTFSTGTIVLSVSVGGNPAPPAVVLTAGALMPGDVVPAGAAGQAVVVANTGTAQLRYALSGTSTDELVAPKHLNTVLLVVVKGPDAVGGTTCTNFTGAPLFSGLVPTGGVNMIGDPAAGTQGGERVLNNGFNETLCFKVSLPSATGVAFQGATSTYTFTFTAEQTANLP
jgi:hypothetical protein